MTEILPVIDDAQPLSFWGWLIMVWTDIIFNFDFEKDWPTVAVFFSTLCVALVVFFEVAKSLGLFGGPEFLGLTKMLPGGKKSASPFTVELKVDSTALRALDVSTKKELWQVSYFSVVNWGYSDNLFQVIFADRKKKEQTVSFATNQGKAISDSLNKKVEFLQDKIQDYVARKGGPIIPQDVKKESPPKQSKKEEKIAPSQPQKKGPSPPQKQAPPAAPKKQNQQGGKAQQPSNQKKQK